MGNIKFQILKFICICTIIFAIYNNVYALDLEKLRLYFLKGEYPQCINEGERLIANAQRFEPGIDELYYLLGLSYLKDGNYLRASDIFEIILNEYKSSKFGEEARLGLGDVYFLKGDFTRARSYYNEIISKNEHSTLEPAVYLRLSKIEFKKGKSESAREYINKLKTDFSLSPEAKMVSSLDDSAGGFYTVQVGSFSKSLNAQNFVEILNKKGYPAYMEEFKGESGTIYRVRVGKLNQRQGALELENKLTKEGYPTKIYP